LQLSFPSPGDSFALVVCFVGNQAALRAVTRPVRNQLFQRSAIRKCDGPFLLGAAFAVKKAFIVELDREIAQSILEGEHQTCRYSKATRGNIDVELILV